VGEEPTLAEIEKILAENKDKAVEGFYVTGHMLDDKINKRGADLAYVLDVFETIKGHATFETKYTAVQEKDGTHHKMDITGKAMGGTVMHEITINYFVMDTEKEEKEKEQLQELLEKESPMVFENKKAKHGILDARIVNKYEIASNLGAMFGYMVSLGSKDYAQIMGVRFALVAEKIFGKKE